jgi:ABC-2 type transport system ATP-binding protein
VERRPESSPPDPIRTVPSRPEPGGVIRIRELTKRYGADSAVDSLSFTVKEGAVTGFLGPNGAGKSTTLRILLGLASPTSGVALINGKRYAALAHPMREVGALLDATAVHPDRTALNHLRCLARSNKIPLSNAGSGLERVGLSAVGRKRVGAFSLGMKQRLGIAAALLGDPAVVIFDEPVNGLDPDGVLWLRNLLRQLAAEGRTVLLSSHLMSELELTADELVIIKRGRLIDHSTTVALAKRFGTGVQIHSPQAPELTRLLTEHGGEVTIETGGALRIIGLDAEQIGDLASEHRIRIHQAVTKRASLEDAYLALTGDDAEHGAVTAGGIQ